ncbi:D-alanine--D-alanine ligase [Aquirufa ecclesiirivi]|uniref:D-alanine--D-alanine ligase n=1 Tax=Aquirufa ecclesiirivi TaxID=2715124 RepID=A0ABT4JHL5_9BACT|nr:D-alanine--D-alanine ligase [Aquirufa ecclesiirivi]MCZ2475765.1 D-alanine--D-alanine ligase [Aquirufa ecclesiirivi]
MMRIGIFFGGPAREREISFAGGKTAMAHINKALFQPVPVFVDSLGNFILIKEELIHASSIRDFFPPKRFQDDIFSVYIESLKDLTEQDYQQIISEIGQIIQPHEFSQYFEFVFLAMHGPAAEDGSIQGLLEWFNMPYSGPGLLGSSIGIDKAKQNEWLKKSIGLDKKFFVLQRQDYEKYGRETLFEQVKKEIGIPFVAKAPHQGSSIGLAFVKKDSLEDFDNAIKKCLFIQEIYREDWLNLTEEDKLVLLQKMVNLDEGIGFPVRFNHQNYQHPADLLDTLQEYFKLSVTKASIHSIHSEDAILLESFVNGNEFSCGVIQSPKGKTVALPPTEIVIDESVEVFDFNAKYKSKATRKRIPMDASLANLQLIQKMVCQAFDDLGFGVCTRIDGFLAEGGVVVLHDPNTIPGMSPSSLIFKQMAEIGLTITDSITYFIRQSLRERMRTGKNYHAIRKQLEALDSAIKFELDAQRQQEKIILEIRGANSDELEACFEAVKKQANALSATGKQAYIVQTPMLLEEGEILITVNTAQWNKDSAVEMLESISKGVHPLIAQTHQLAQEITEFYTTIKTA